MLLPAPTMTAVGPSIVSIVAKVFCVEPDDPATAAWKRKDAAISCPRACRSQEVGIDASRVARAGEHVLKADCLRDWRRRVGAAEAEIRRRRASEESVAGENLTRRVIVVAAKDELRCSASRPIVNTPADVARQKDNSPGVPALFRAMKAGPVTSAQRQSYPDIIVRTIDGVARSPIAAGPVPGFSGRKPRRFSRL